jgi:hypothetical protein
VDDIKVPYKVEFKVATFEGEWTAEQIENGEAPEPRIDISSAWYEPTPDGPIQITDPVRIQELEDGIR